MQADKEGFNRPVIDSEACIHCGLCEKSCPVLQADDGQGPVRADAAQADCYTAWATHPEDLGLTSSGGILTQLALHALRGGRAVSLVAYDKAMHPRRMLAQSEAEILHAAGSKYVQAHTDHEHYRQIRDLLKAGVPVLFIGTPCQNAALHRFLRKDHPLLLTAEFLCHGTPSPLLLQKYIAWKQTVSGRTMQNLDMRGKHVGGWVRPSTDHYYTDGSTERIPNGLNPYYRLFCSLLPVNKACFHCRYCSTTRYSDITCGDHNRDDASLCARHGREGISVLLGNTEKGRAAIRGLAQQGLLHLEKDDVSGHIRRQHTFRRPETLPARHAEFMAALPQEDFPTLLHRFIPPHSLSTRMKGTLSWWVRCLLCKLRGTR